MKITKYVHACLLVEEDNKVAIFDPGSMSRAAFDISKLNQLDYIFITHIHQDHLDVDFVKDLVAKFPACVIDSTNEVVKMLSEQGIKAQSEPVADVTFFDAPHESVEPLFPAPEEVGIHYLVKLSDPGDSHSFSETKEILALPITAPWGSTTKALNLAIELKPKYVIPIHDWHWNDQAREQMYDRAAQALEKEGITFFKPETGVTIDTSVN
jgi:L-ascorbate metabolism protein UlaG (beta-lactamase superfamily)